MTIREILIEARKDVNTIFSRKSWREGPYHPKGDTYRVNIKGRINQAFEEYKPYDSVSFHTDSLMAEDWEIVSK